MDLFLSIVTAHSHYFLKQQHSFCFFATNRPDSKARNEFSFIIEEMVTGRIFFGVRPPRRKAERSSNTRQEIIPWKIHTGMIMHQLPV